MVRGNDETGVSGTGKIIEGVQFSDGQVVTRWNPPTSPGRSTVVWDSLGAFLSVHVTPHPGNRTIVRFWDGEVYSTNEHGAIIKSRTPAAPVKPQEAK